MEDLLQQLTGILPALLVVTLIKIPLALLAWRGMLAYFDHLLGINFREVYHAWPADLRADYHGKRALAAAIICAAVFL